MNFYKLLGVLLIVCKANAFVKRLCIDIDFNANSQALIFEHEEVDKGEITEIARKTFKWEPKYYKCRIDSDIDKCKFNLSYDVKEHWRDGSVGTKFSRIANTGLKICGVCSVTSNEVIDIENLGLMYFLNTELTQQWSFFCFIKIRKTAIGNYTPIEQIARLI